MFEKIKGILSDIDGTLYFKGKPTKDAIDSVSELRKKNYKLLFFTNTDSKSPKKVIERLNSLGFNVKDDEIYTPINALKEFLTANLDKKSYFITTQEVAEEFKSFPTVKGSEIPDYVILCDFHDNWTVDRLNQAFKYILKGAKLIGSQGNIYYLDKDGEPVLDTGSFVKMLSVGTNSSPKIFGKPSTPFFKQALKKLNLNKEEVLAIGDDFHSDIEGAQKAGLKAVLVKTGKGKYYQKSGCKISPDLIIENFSMILKFL